jgi:protein-S-isoprenylcysteine O-methyltransferase Ste14
MDTARRVLAILLIVGTPPAITFWLLVHPLADFWRRLGPRLAYALLAAAGIVLAGLLFLLRDRLLGRDLGTSVPLIAVGTALYAGSMWLSVLCRRQLRTSVFAGGPELSPRAYPGRLLQEGVYALIRHPRYASVIIGTSGVALAANHAGAYLVLGISLLLLWPVILLEERELAARFGPEYEVYRRRTPALLPRWAEFRRAVSGN